jgi:hypothetical protein
MTFGKLTDRMQGLETMLADIENVLRYGCQRCLMLEKDHGPEGKCLFAPTIFEPFTAKAVRMYVKYRGSSEHWDDFAKKEAA